MFDPEPEEAEQAGSADVADAPTETGDAEETTAEGGEAETSEA